MTRQVWAINGLSMKSYQLPLGLNWPQNVRIKTDPMFFDCYAVLVCDHDVWFENDSSLSH